jgi:mannose/cellobiose epimerase-like protein (N-acyl-D-glucosamine 2-epimerase family)
MSALETDLAAARDDLLAWLMNDALPIWWRVGADHDGGGFHEAIGLDGLPVIADRRARVQARQTFTYAVGGALGWAGPWREAVTHGLDYFLSRYRRLDGLFWNVVTAEGAPIEVKPHLYEQAFVLLTLATVSEAAPDPALAQIAVTLRDRLVNDRRGAAGGFTGFVDDAVFQSDPHMHLFEAALAWEQVAPSDPAWAHLADEVAELCLARFISPERGLLMEYFQSDWAPSPGQAGHLAWPGHQFEWAGLLERWALKRGREDVRAIARRLFDLGANHGIDPVRGVAVFELLDDLSVNDPKARLWSQTEWLKAALILIRSESDSARRDLYLANALAGARALRLYLATSVPGLWRDKLLADGAWVDEPAPASSFYHIIDALRVLAAWRGG